MKAKWFSTLLVLTLLLVSVVPVASAAPQPPVEDLGPLHMSAYEKLYLGWSNYTTVNYNQKAEVKINKK